MTLTEILGCIGGGVIVSLSGILLISWFKEWIVLFIKTWREERTSPELDLNKLESKLDNALDKETTESLNEWIDKKRLNMEQQTAMQAAIAHYKDLSEKGNNQAYVVAKFLEDNFLEMEKQQLIDATTRENVRCTEIANTTLKILGLEPVFMVDDTWGKHYYNNTFKND